jgi:4-alpha-glucanotransferase
VSSRTEIWGVETQFRRASGEWVHASQETLDRILEAMNAGDGPPAKSTDGPIIVTAGIQFDATGAWTIVLESGEELTGSGPFPLDLPLGYHRISNDEAEDRCLIVAPNACPPMTGALWWGWTAQLYALRSAQSWGIGDFGDLHNFADLVSSDGAGFVIVNPLHASLPGLPQESSPYYPSSREFINPLYIRIEEVPGAETLNDLVALAEEGRALNADRRIDRDTIWTMKINALREIWANVTPGADFESFVDTRGESLRKYAIFCTLSEQHGRQWQRWPEELRHPNSPAVTEFANAQQNEVRFHQWVQWLLDLQLAKVTGSLSLIQDLAIGIDPAGADAWLWQDVMALGVRVGAPPDRFNASGQDWAIPPFDPWKLRAANYEPFIRTLRAALGHGGGVRIDHVMGLFRQYWIPEGSSPLEGSYVRYPWTDLLAIVALESQRSGAVVIGEDLGTVEPFVRTELSARNILSYKLLWHQKMRATEYPVHALAAVTTHDLPTIAGLWSGRDLEIQRALGMTLNTEATDGMKDQLKGWLDVDDSAPVEEVAQKAHHLLAQAPSSMVSATVEDALGLEERPNYPGTTKEWPNWSVALPIELEQLKEAPGYLRTVEAFRTVRNRAQRQRDDVS